MAIGVGVSSRLLFGVALFAACVPSLPPGSCDAYVEAYCTKLADCNPYELEVDFGADRASALATCKTRTALACAVEADANDRIDVVGCTNALPAVSCDDVAAGALPPSCRTRRVAVAGDDGTGACAEKVAIGEACVTSTVGKLLPCEDDAICDAATGTCVPRGQLGAACTFAAQCRPTLYCSNAATPSIAGVCVARGQLGDGCSPTSPCDDVQLLTCVGSCKASDLSLAECGPVFDLPDCASARFCNVSKGGGGLCFAAAADGEACTYGANNCLPPARCLGRRCVITGIDCR